LWPIDDENDVEVACESLTRLICSSNSEIIGCGLEGRLLDRAWKLVLGQIGETTIFLSQRRGDLMIENIGSTQCGFHLLASTEYILG
jgi:hypothetical protein